MEPDTSLVVSELSQARELLRTLEAHLGSPSVEMCKSLVQEIMLSVDKVLFVARSGNSDVGGHRQPAESSFTDSPRSSENSEEQQAFKQGSRPDGPKKRKSTVAKWRNQVRLGSGPGVEGPLDDGYSWRKYGQKDILGAKYPRGYYRCTHRKSQSCLAMKQVQRSDDNPSVFDVTYRGTHTCVRKPTAPSTPRNQDQQQLLMNFQTNLKVETENLDSKPDQLPSTPSSFSFPSTPATCMGSENHIFSSRSPTLDNNFMGSFSPTFISPATSESNYFSVSPCRLGSYNCTGANVQASESDFTEIVSAATSTANSPMMDMDFMLSSVEINTDFPFDTSAFFSEEF